MRFKQKFSRFEDERSRERAKEKAKNVRRDAAKARWEFAFTAGVVETQKEKH